MTAQAKRRRHTIIHPWLYPQVCPLCGAERKMGRGRPWRLNGKPAPYCAGEEGP